MVNYKRNGLSGAFMLVMIGLLLGGLIPSSETHAQDPGQWKPVTIVYNSDVGGKIDPCG